MTDRQAEIAALETWANTPHLNLGFSEHQLQAQAALAEIKQLTDRNAFLETTALQSSVAEITRERDEALAERDKWIAEIDAREDRYFRQALRLDTAESEIAELQSILDQFRVPGVSALLSRAEAAEAGIKQRDEALAEIARYVETEWRYGDKAFQIALVARTALAGVGCTDTEPQGSALGATMFDRFDQTHTAGGDRSAVARAEDSE